MERKARILIIDDEEDICRYSKSLLEKTGRFEAAATTNARQGVALARKNPPDLILLDVNMPDMDGGDVVRELEDFPATKDIPVLFVTALLRRSEEHEDKVGKHHYIAKPVQPAELIRKIDSLLPPAKP